MTTMTRGYELDSFGRPKPTPAAVTANTPQITAVRLGAEYRGQIFPRVEVELDRKYASDHLRFEHRAGLWRADDGVLGCFYAHSGNERNEGGFGGAVVDITMIDGTKKKLAGPWSSSPSSVNATFHDRLPLMDVVLKNSSINVTVMAVEEWLRKHSFPIDLVLIDAHGSHVWTCAEKGKPAHGNACRVELRRISA